jgi:hypothetical protein
MTLRALSGLSSSRIVINRCWYLSKGLRGTKERKIPKAGVPDGQHDHLKNSQELLFRKRVIIFWEKGTGVVFGSGKRIIPQIAVGAAS